MGLKYADSEENQFLKGSPRSLQPGEEVGEASDASSVCGLAVYKLTKEVC